MKLSKFIKTSIKSPLCFVRYVKYRIMCERFGVPVGSNVGYACGLRVRQRMSNVKIGSRCSFGGNVGFHADDAIEVGDDSLFAYGVNIITAGHDYNSPLMKKLIVENMCG